MKAVGAAIKSAREDSDLEFQAWKDRQQSEAQN